MNIRLDRVMTVKRTYTMVRIFRPNAPVPVESHIFNEDEVEAQEELVRLCEQHDVAYEVEHLRPH